MFRRPFVRSLLPFALALLAASCGSDVSTGVSSRGSPDALSLPLVGGPSPTLLACDPPGSAQSVTATVGPLGGVLSLGATRVTIPEDAVLVPTTFTLSIPASRLVEISVRAANADHYLFLKPVLVTIDYGRCASSVPLLAPLSVWHIDETTKALLESMGGVDLRALHTITFFTGHLSGYAVAD